MGIRILEPPSWTAGEGKPPPAFQFRPTGGRTDATFCKRADPGLERVADPTRGQRTGPDRGSPALRRSGSGRQSSRATTGNCTAKTLKCKTLSLLLYRTDALVWAMNSGMCKGPTARFPCRGIRCLRPLPSPPCSSPPVWAASGATSPPMTWPACCFSHKVGICCRMESRCSRMSSMPAIRGR